MKALIDIDLKSLIENETGNFFDKKGFIKCPFHNEKTASMSVKFFPDANKQKFKCFGCEEVGDAIDFIQKIKGFNYTEARKYLDIAEEETEEEKKLEQLENFINWQIKKQEDKKGFSVKGIFSFVDSQNNVLYYKVKFLKPDNKKTTSYYHIDGDKVINARKGEEVPYNYYNTLKALEEGKTIIFVEGEKDANTINALFKNNYYTATSIKGLKDFSTLQRTGMKVFVISDTGEAGEKYGKKIFDEYAEYCSQFKFINLPGLKNMGDNKDVTDWIEAGKNKNDLLKAFKRSLDLKAKYELQQDWQGIFRWYFDKNTEDWGKRYITDFKLLEAKRLKFIDEDLEGIKLIAKSCTDEVIEKIGYANVFDDVKSFKNFLGTLDLSFKGKTDDLTELGSWVNRFFAIDNEEIHEGIQFIEKSNEIKLITAEYSISKEDIDYSIKADKAGDMCIIDKEITKEELELLIHKLFRFTVPSKSIPIVGSVINNLAVLQNKAVKEKLHHLLIIGESGSGKSTILTNVVAPLLNYPLKEIKSIGLITSFALIKELSTGNYTSIFDEFKPSSLDKYKIQKLSETLRNSYDRVSISRGDKSLKTKEFQLSRPLIMAGEESYPNSETALIERSCIVYLSKRERKEEHTESMMWLIENEELLKKLGRSLINIVLNLSAEEYKAIRENSKRNFTELKNRPERTALNIACGMEILNILLNKHGINKLTDYEKFIIANIKDEILEGEEESKSVSENMLILYNQMLEDGRAGMQSDVIKEQGHKVYIKTSEMINEIFDFVNKVGSAEIIPLKLKDFRKQAQKSGYILNTGKVIKFAGKTMRYDEYSRERLQELKLNAIIEPDFTDVTEEENKIIQGVFK